MLSHIAVHILYFPVHIKIGEYYFQGLMSVCCRLWNLLLFIAISTASSFFGLTFRFFFMWKVLTCIFKFSRIFNPEFIHKSTVKFWFLLNLNPYSPEDLDMSSVRSQFQLSFDLDKLASLQLKKNFSCITSHRLCI